MAIYNPTTAWISCILLIHAFNFAESFLNPQFKRAALRYDSKLYNHNQDRSSRDYERRSFLTTAASMIGLVTAFPANAIEKNDSSVTASVPSLTTALMTTGDFDCLLDLPPITPGCVRIYFCRHGQTENNRLNLMQGARVDPEINGNGIEQAQRLGMAISRLTKSSSGRGVVPTLAVHSNLRRARETAQVLTSTASSQSTNIKVYGELPSLGEVDFGNLEGKDVKAGKAAMRSTFARWSIGEIDARTGGEGESGREVLERTVVSLEELAKIATSSSTTSSSILAVSHSTYLRVLLSLAGDTPLAESALGKLQNGSVNVVDVSVEGKKRLVTSKSGLFGGEIVGT
eukprot:CAMPEP_0183720726 /NCGR_PEP_ID=MMETSP0737-20130205/13257_1 /TAXON_ID=385413 /ORGANISM="Thalassiosira miniscula, Strain CCMP1093" /LENGTH=343 /DNA_ID=CAMNT_0025950641 /DNA_START=143 /DNA_END=1171 /DNA_ORIENTATION=+